MHSSINICLVACKMTSLHPRRQHWTVLGQDCSENASPQPQALDQQMAPSWCEKAATKRAHPLCHQQLANCYKIYLDGRHIGILLPEYLQTSLIPGTRRGGSCLLPVITLSLCKIHPFATPHFMLS